MLAVLLPLLAGCGGRSAEGEVVVFAAASLTDVFAAMQEGFNQERPDVTVTYNLANSAALATQINEGAPADVFASAGQTQTDAVAAAAGATTPSPATCWRSPSNPATRSASRAWRTSGARTSRWCWWSRRPRPVSTRVRRSAPRA